MKNLFTAMALAVGLLFVTTAPASAMTYLYTHNCYRFGKMLHGKARVYQYSRSTRQANLSQTKYWKQSVSGPNITWTYHGFNFGGLHYSGPTSHIRFAGGSLSINRPVEVVWKGKRRYLPDPTVTCTLYVH